MLRDSTTAAAAATVVVVVVRTRPRELPLATITWENQFMGFLYFLIWVWGSAWWPFGPPELRCMGSWCWENAGGMNYLTNARNDSRKRKQATMSARPTTPVTWGDNSFEWNMILIIYISYNLRAFHFVLVIYSVWHQQKKWKSLPFNKLSQEIQVYDKWLIYKQPHQDIGLCGFSPCIIQKSVSPRFIELYGDARLVPFHGVPARWPLSNRNIILSLNFATEVRHNYSIVPIHWRK